MHLIQMQTAVHVEHILVKTFNLCISSNAQLPYSQDTTAEQLMVGRLMLLDYLGYQLNNWNGCVYRSPWPLSPVITGPLLVSMPVASSASS